ncbi:MAG: hypothetical protein WB947_07390 [Thermoplasmata archaeon]
MDVYLFPAVVGGGLGDIEEVLAAGRELSRAGFRTVRYRRPGHPMPRSVDGPWEWPPIERRTRLAPRAPAALTISPAWGVSAAPTRNEAYGRGGAWEFECRDVERRYGRSSTLHVSLEEFARTLGSVEENRERLREGGVTSRALPAALVRSRRAGELERLRRAFVRYRAFDRANVVHLFATFRRSPRFAREFPEAVQVGPLWPRRFSRVSESLPRAHRREWVWYASPASAERIAPEVVEALSVVHPPVHLYVRTPRSWTLSLPADRVEIATGAVDPEEWHRRFARAELRIVTGSRTLLEAIELGGPFLYFNGVLGPGARRRRHRPEKVIALLDVFRRARVNEGLRQDLADFARGRRVGAVVRKAAGRGGGWRRFPRRLPSGGFRPPYDDAGEVIVALARALERTPHDAENIVSRARAGALH